MDPLTPLSEEMQNGDIVGNEQHMVVGGGDTQSQVDPVPVPVQPDGDVPEQSPEVGM